MSLKELPPHYDVIVIGGGITGAGVVREAAAAGLKTLLVEQRDYAWGRSSRSSRMIHGDLRHLASGHPGLTRQAVVERQRLIDQVPGLVDPMRYVTPHYRKSFPGPRLFQKALWLYDRMAGESTRQHIPLHEILQWLPGLEADGLRGVSAFTDAITDDARLVLRVLAEARALGAATRNYTRATHVEKPEHAPWRVTIADRTGEGLLTASVVVNATGAWTEQLWRTGHGKDHIRLLRGSHLLVPFERLPVSVALIVKHPVDQRLVYLVPWMGSTVVGTTDMDHDQPLSREPRITAEEVTYLLQAIESAFPHRPLTTADIRSTWAGVRPVATRSENRKPSAESRDHVIWEEGGLISVAGGKLTTFRRKAREVLLTGIPRLPDMALVDEDEPLFRPATLTRRPGPIKHQTWQRLRGHYGPWLEQVLSAGPLEPVAGTDYLWAELHWAAKHEAVVHLDDLILRRTRLGLLRPEGADDLLPEIQRRLEPVIGWSPPRWQREIERYRQLWRAAHYLPDAMASVHASCSAGSPKGM